MSDVLHHLHRALVEKITHLFGDLAPCAGRIVPENQSHQGQQNEDERGEREHGVIGQGGAKLGRFVLHPFRGGLFKEIKDRPEKV